MMQFKTFYWRSHYGIWAISKNLLVVYCESVNLIGYITRRLSADSLQLWIANENRLLIKVWLIFQEAIIEFKEWRSSISFTNNYYQ